MEQRDSSAGGTKMGIARRSRLLIAVAVAVLAAGLGITAPTNAAPPPEPTIEGGRGQLDHHDYGVTNGGIPYDYLVYVPEGWKRTDNLPLYVMLHGCATTATQMMGAAWLNPIADRERFIVAYPDNGGGCWRAVSDDALVFATEQKDVDRGAGGDADIVADMTKRIIADYNVDTSRVYLAGGSAGAFQTSGTVSAYPELYTAVGIVAGGGPGMAVTCAGHQKEVVPGYAQWAVDQMADRAHVIPFFVIAGTEDPLGHLAGVTGCSELAYQEMLYINNLLVPSAKAPVPGACGLLPPRTTGLSLSPCTDTYMTNAFATEQGQVPGGRKYTRKSAQHSATLCEIGQQWIVHGMGHTWPGPSGNTTVQGDPKAPNGSQLSWDFFKRFRLVDGQVVCTPPEI